MAKVTFKLKCGHTYTEHVPKELLPSLNVKKLFCRKCHQIMKVAKIIHKRFKK